MLKYWSSSFHYVNRLMIFVSSLLDVLRMSVSAISFLALVDSNFFLPVELFSLTYDLTGFKSIDTFFLCVFSKQVSPICFSFFLALSLVNSCPLAAVQPCQNYTPIKKKMLAQYAFYLIKILLSTKRTHYSFFRLLTKKSTQEKLCFQVESIKYCNKINAITSSEDTIEKIADKQVHL